MILSDAQFDAIFRRRRNGLIAKDYRWPNRSVPYEMSKYHSKQQQNQIELAMREIESVSCIKFVRHTNETDYIEFTVSYKSNGAKYSNENKKKIHTKNV